MESYKDNYLIHYGIPGMKWGHRKQRISNPRAISAKKAQRMKQKQNYKLIKQRAKQTGTNINKLQNYEKGGLSSKKVKKALGSDIKVSQVSDYLKENNRRATIGTIIGGVIGTSLAVALNRKRII